jgi:hypothetical protein
VFAEVDNGIIWLVDYINSHDSMVTTAACEGDYRVNQFYQVHPAYICFHCSSYEDICGILKIVAEVNKKARFVKRDVGMEEITDRISVDCRWSENNDSIFYLMHFTGEPTLNRFREILEENQDG